MKAIDRVGQKFGFLEILSLAHTDLHWNRFVVAKCHNCGNTITTRLSGLTSGKTVSCGCYRRAEAAKRGRAQAQSRRKRTKPILGFGTPWAGPVTTTWKPGYGPDQDGVSE